MTKIMLTSGLSSALVHTNMSKILENIEETDDDSDYKSDFDSEEEETNDILEKILKHWKRPIKLQLNILFLSHINTYKSIKFYVLQCLSKYGL